MQKPLGLLGKSIDNGVEANAKVTREVKTKEDRKCVFFPQKNDHVYVNLFMHYNLIKPGL